jgi:hypothetical protein
MKTEKIIMIGLWVVIAIGVLFAGYIIYDMQSANAAPVVRGAPGSAITTGTTGDGDVEITLTPRGIADGYIVFDFALNTHTVDLSTLDLRQAAVLEYNGKRVTAAEAPQLGGHHINDALTFPVQGNPSSFSVRITGVPTQQERIFAW